MVLLIAVIVVVPAFLALNLLLPTRTISTGCITLECAISMSSPVVASADAHQWFNFTILRLNETLSPDDMTFVARNPVGTLLYPLNWTILFVHPSSAKPLAAYNINTGMWDYAGSVSLARGDILSVDVGSSNVDGITLVAIGMGSVSATLSLPLN